MTAEHVQLRPEEPGDAAAIGAVITAAFAQPAEAELVARLRAAQALTVSHVACRDGRIIGHVALSPVTVEGQDDGERWLGLAPVAVHPDHQGRGVGRQLVAHALETAARHDAAVVFVLGRPDYYDRLGFAEAAPLGWRCIYDVPSAAFRVHRLGEGAGLPPSGTVRYHPAFDSL